MGPASCDASPTGSVGLLQQLEVALADDGSTTSTCRASLPIAWRHSDLVSTVLGVSERTRVLLASKHHGGAEHLSTAGTAALTTAQQTVLCQPAQSTDTCMSPLCCPWPRPPTRSQIVMPPAAFIMTGIMFMCVPHCAKPIVAIFAWNHGFRAAWWLWVGPLPFALFFVGMSWPLVPCFGKKPHWWSPTGGMTIGGRTRTFYSAHCNSLGLRCEAF